MRFHRLFTSHLRPLDDRKHVNIHNVLFLEWYDISIYIYIHIPNTLEHCVSIKQLQHTRSW